MLACALQVIYLEANCHIYNSFIDWFTPQAALDKLIFTL